MKKITLFLALAVGFGFAASAQRNASQITQDARLNAQFTVSHSDAKTTSDTIWPTAISNGCDTSTLYSVPTADGGGYVTGNNGYGDLEKGTLVKHAGNGSVTTVFAYLYRAGSVGTSTIKANVYSKGSDNLPDALLGSSVVVPISDIAIESPQMVPFTFASPIAVSGDFFVTIVLPTTTGDTIAVVSNTESCTPLNDTLTIEKWGDGTFAYLKTAYSGSLNIDLFIATVVESVSGIANNTIENINVYATSNQIVIENNDNATIKQVSVYDLLGKEVAKYDVNSNGSVKLSADFASSNYVVKVITDKKVGSYKLFVR